MDQSHRIWQSNGSAAHMARFVPPPVRAGSIARLPFAKRSPGLFWLFLQSNNSQCSNCQIRNTRISAAAVTPMLGILATRRAGPPNADVSPVRPVLSGTHQARFSRQLGWLFSQFAPK
jgi:hypothetical protein